MKRSLLEWLARNHIPILWGSVLLITVSNDLFAVTLSALNVVLFALIWIHKASS